MNEKNYYTILNVDQSSKEDEIKQAYRKLALQYHPDRNPGDKDSEEHFKLISEAYAVLTDPVKRAQYNRTLSGGSPFSGGSGNFTGFNQDEVLREFFTSDQARQMFKDLSREFERFGLRLDDKFIKRFFSGSQKFFVGGFFFSGSFDLFRQGKASAKKAPKGPGQVRKTEIGSPDILGGLKAGIGRLISGAASLLTSAPKLAEPQSSFDIEYNVTINRNQVGANSKIKLVYKRNNQNQTLMVAVPPDVKSGAKLRMSGMGHDNPDGENGDLYLTIRFRD